MNVENFRFDISLAITKEPQDIMEILIKYFDSLADFTSDWYIFGKKL